MPEKFKGKYRIESNRLRGWDYSSDALYFITFNNADRECYFGEIHNGEMILNDFGKIANDEWLKSFEMRQELFLDEYIIMPNHIHAIIKLENNKTERPNGNGRGSERLVDTGCGSARPCGSTSTNQSPQPFIRKPKSISSFVAGYKSAVINQIDDFIDENKWDTKKFNKRNPLWQSNYHDHIIRNHRAYWRIKNYIRKNPQKWDNDKFNKYD